MKVKNLVLFGFVVSALSYLNEQAKKDNEEGFASLNGIEDIDLQAVRDEIGKRLETTVSEFGDVVSSIVSIGQEAFDHYINETDNEKEVSLQDIEYLIKQETNDSENEKKDNILNNLDKDIDDFFAGDSQDDLPIENEKIIPNHSDEEEPVENLLNSFFNGLTLQSEIKNNEVSADDYFKEIEKAVATNPDYQETDNDAVDDLFSQLIENEKKDEENAKEIDSLFNEIISAENDHNLEQDNEQLRNKYVHDLVGELKEELSTSEKKEDTSDDNETIHNKINELYPYLSLSFIRNVYDLKETIAQEYPLNEKIIVLHRLRFEDVDNLRQFVEIVSNHGYNVNADENQLIVDIFKCYINTDGKILNNIFEIANQARLLHGHYEGYRIDAQEEE